MLSWGFRVNFYLFNVVCKQWIKTSQERPPPSTSLGLVNTLKNTLNDTLYTKWRHLSVIQSVQSVTDRYTYVEIYKQTGDTVY